MKKPTPPKVVQEIAGDRLRLIGAGTDPTAAAAVVVPQPVSLKSERVQ